MKIYAGDALCINIIRREVGTKTRSGSVTSVRSVMMLSVRAARWKRGTLLVYKAANFEQRDGSNSTATNVAVFQFITE